MRHIIITTLTLLIMVSQNHAQQSLTEKITVFNTVVLPQYSNYFSGSGLAENGQLMLTASDNFGNLESSSKKILMNSIVKEWPESMIIVSYGSKKELWGLNDEAGTSIMIYHWDLNVANTSSASLTPASKISKHPFFIYVGGQGVLDSQHNLNAAINTRVGFFLVRNRWDLAWTFSGGIIGTIDTSAVTNQLSAGLMSKVYFPIPKLNISPNVGVDLQSTTFIDSEGRDSQSASRSILAGISWYVGPGSFDAGVRLNKAPSFSIGYTLMPGQLGLKNK